MNEEYRGFNLYGGSEPITRRYWPGDSVEADRMHSFRTHSLSYHRAAAAFVFNEEIARLLMDSSFRDFSDSSVPKREADGRGNTGVTVKTRKLKTRGSCV
jgi:hypothetical protein